jgi:glucose-1-phosphate thymidylyltransferase
MKGILLAGGRGSRLLPSTLAVSKQLLPIYDKPMIYYPLSVLMLAGIRDIVVVATPDGLPAYRRLLGDGGRIGISITYREQADPKGIADALLVCADLIDGEPSCLILGDNVFYGLGFSDLLAEGGAVTAGATIFGYQVADPTSFGVVEVDAAGRAVSLEEKPEHPRSNLAVPGLYFYGPDAVERAQSLSPSARGELEITDLNRKYLERGDLRVIDMGRGMAWLDTGTPHGLMLAGQYVEAVQNRQGMYIACIEEIAWRKGFIDEQRLLELGEELSPTDYGNYISQLPTWSRR